MLKISVLKMGGGKFFSFLVHYLDDFLYLYIDNKQNIINNMLKNLKSLLVVALLCVCVGANAQLKYTSEGKITLGDTSPHEFYTMTMNATGAWLKCKTNNFFQIDLTPSIPRLAGTGDQVCFYNTRTSTFNSIQVKNVYNYSDARAKTNVQNLNNGLSSILKLRPVSYTFADNSSSSILKTGGNGNEIGLLAQEVEKVLPNVVLTDDEGNKLINYTAIIPVMIDAIKTLQSEVETLKSNK